MSAGVLAFVLFAALPHATWNALLKSGEHKLAGAVQLCVVTGLLVAVIMLHESFGLRRWQAAGLITLGVAALKLF